MNDAPRASVRYLTDRHKSWKAFCTKKKTLQSEYPEIAAQWHPVKNGDLTPDQVASKSNQKRWWMCSAGHEWEAIVSNRTKGSGCPYSARRKIMVGTNDLATKRPELVVEWHPVKNNTLRPQDVTEFSHKKVWWMCLEGHEWQAVISSRSTGSGCPYCAHKKVIPSETDLATLAPDLVEEWHPTKNGDLIADAVTPHSLQRVWWRCKKGHEWQTSISNRMQGKGCPYCCGKYVIPGKTDLATLHPALAAEWNSEKNGTLAPDQVTSRSHRKVWWTCSRGHTWYADIYHRVAYHAGCPYCSHQVPTVGENDLATVNPGLAAQWHPTKNHLKPTEVTCGSSKKAWWICPQGHEWQAVIKSRNAGSGCPYCAGNRVISGVDDIATVYPHLVSSWNYEKNKGITPEQVKAKTLQKFWWKCSCCGDSWYIAAVSISGNSDQLVCPKCQGHFSRII